MSKILKNQTGSPIAIADTGVTLPASPDTYTIPQQDYPLWAASTNITALLTGGSVKVNNGLVDLLAADASAFMKLAFDRIDNLTSSSLSPRMTEVTTTTLGSLVLTRDSNFCISVIGTAVGYKVVLPDATTLKLPVNGALKFEVFNRGTTPVNVAYNDTTNLYQVATNAYVQLTLRDNTTPNGDWLIVVTDIIDITNPDFAGVKDGFEDFMFDAYAGAGGNDNQYSFTPEVNSGSSNIDTGSAVGNDYEGIHILDTLISASSRPLVASFNNVNRMKLGAQPESFEFRVRIETLADIAQKFTARYGLMDVSTIGLPANGIIFSYDPVYPITPVTQVVTVTPIVTSKEPTQLFTETINGTPYTHTYLTTETVTTTPNSFPVATFQQISVAQWTRTNNTLYTITINGFVSSYTSDATATDAEIAIGLRSAINANTNINTVVVAAGSAKPFTVTSLVLGLAFTYSGSANITTITLVTANVPVEQYTQTINGTPYTYVSDGTPTATEVCNGLRALINADGPLPVTASGTTTLILTADVLGASFTHSPSANMSTVDNTPSTTATAVVTGLKTLINADGPLPVTATGTTTLILTADVPGTAFTNSGTANLTQVLTTANVVQVFYSGNWIAQVINASTTTSLNTGIPIVANRWYRLKMVVSSDGLNSFIYIDNLSINKISTAIPLVALRFVFKLEKTLGTVSRTTSIDYITWRRTRG
jgi:hypothetical protein